MADTSNRGFASMDDEKQREIASKGGHAAHDKGTAHEFSSEEAREAGRKGGKNSHSSSEKEEEDDDNSPQKSTRGGTPEQHAKAGRQSHKNK